MDLQRLMSEWKARGEEQHYDTIIPQAAEVETDTIILLTLRNS